MSDIAILQQYLVGPRLDSRRTRPKRRSAVVAFSVAGR